MKFANGDTWGPTQIDSCDSGASPLTRVQQSPLVVKQNWTWGGTSIGIAQVTDAFQRAEFWKYAQPAGINPTYNVNLSWTTASPITINVPSADAAAGCQANLEVGDPLTGTTYTDTVGGFTYHPQELAFSSWFYHQSPSLGVNGWYSDQGTFRAPAAAC